MKRPARTALWLAGGLLAALFPARSAPVVMDKAALGPVHPNSLSMVLTSSECDATGDRIPDGSKLVSERFSLVGGVDRPGHFAGVARILTPDGRTVARGILRGTAGVPGPGAAGADCLAPGRLDGLLTAYPTAGTTDAAEDALAPPGLLLNFHATRVPQANTPDLYEGRLSGLLAVTDAPPAAAVIPTRLIVAPRDPIVAEVVNRSDRPLEAQDLKTDCTILWLERRTDGAWKRVVNCFIERVSQTIVLDPGQSVRVTLPGIPLTQPGREPGVYRLALEYRLRTDAGEPMGDVLTVFSPPITVAGITPPTGKVTVTPDRLTYPQGATVRGVVANRTNQPVASLPTGSFCTILSLQRRAGDTWTPVGTCSYFVEPDPVVLPPNAVHFVNLPPGKETPLAPGTYRMVLTYWFVSPDSTQQPDRLTATSPEFAVLGAEPAPVRVSPGKPVYLLGEPIQATVFNGTTGPIGAYAFNSYCTILSLLRRTDAGWKPEAWCMLTGGPLVSIPPKTEHRVSLPPDKQMPNHPAGVYKLLLRYQALDAAGKPVGETREAESPVFNVAAVVPPAPLVVASARAVYDQAQPLEAVLTAGPQPVTVMDGHTMCTIVTLQIQTDAGWTDVLPCLTDQAQRPTTIAAGQTVLVPLVRNAAWDQGRYRFLVEYWLPDPATGAEGPARTAVSEPFSVNPAQATPVFVVQPEKASYAATETVTAVLANGFKRTRVMDMESFCGIVRMEHLRDGNWVRVGPCILAKAPSPTYFAPGETRKTALPPGTAAPAWQPGVYRLSVTGVVVDENGTPLSREWTSVSRSFTIGTDSPGRVAVLPDKAVFAPDEPVTAVVANRSTAVLRAWKSQSFCQVLALERLVEDATNLERWETIQPCPMMGLPVPVDIPPGGALKVALPRDGEGAAWTAGTYRLRLPFSTIDAAGVEHRGQVTSEPFRIGAEATGMKSVDVVFPTMRPMR